MINLKEENKLIWIDYLRVIATFSVVLLHVSADKLYQYGAIPNNIWMIGNFYDSSVRFCVPIFLMITGALILPKNYELGIFLKKRLFRIIFPFLFWSIIYILYNYVLMIINGENITSIGTFSWVGQQLKFGASYHLWYVYMIIGIYLFIPIIGKWVRNCNEKEIFYFLIIWGCSIFLNQPYLLDYKINIDLTYFSGYLGYVILGYYLTIKKFEKIKFTKIISISLILLGLSITAIGTYLFTISEGKFNEAFYSYLSPNILIVSIGVFLLCKNIFTSNQKESGIIKLISKFSFGIYLIHVLILSIFHEIGLNLDKLNPIIGIPITSIFCLSISIGIIYSVNKLPFGKYISG